MRNPAENLPMPVFSVSGITLEIKELLEINLSEVWVEGEVSNFVHHTSGHLYFTLKDENAQLACVVWRQRAAMLMLTPRDGLKIRAYGSIRVYEKRGVYQLDILRILPAGIGELQAAFEELKAKLRNEGLFDAQHKKPLPPFPQAIGIISSADGAAVRDILQILNRRAPYVKKILRPTLVQGDGAPADIVAALRDFNDYGQVDLIILARGGGSIEDLWAFNEEAVVRAIFASKIPVVSAVGHEVDFTLADFVADLRAPTPSAAAELVVKPKVELAAFLTDLYRKQIGSLRRAIESRKTRLQWLQAAYAFRRPTDLVRQRAQRMDELQRNLWLQQHTRMLLLKERFQNLSNRLRNLHPASVLQRGYALVHDPNRNVWIAEADKVDETATMQVFFRKGAVSAAILSKDLSAKLPFNLEETL